MTTLVTGGTGLVGGHVARQLAQAGEAVRVLVRPHSRKAGLEGIDWQEAAGDVRDLDSLRRAMKGVRRVVHAAAHTRIAPFDPERARTVNVEGTRNVVAAAAEAGVERLLFVSSTAAIGAGTLDRPADESTVWNLAHKGPYWTTKRAAEQVVLDAVRREELDAVVVNPAFAFGAFDVKPSSGALLLGVASGLALAYPEGGGSFVAARDAAAGAILALEKGRTGERYALCAEHLTWRQVLEMAAQELGVRPPAVPLPRELAGLFARIGDAVGPRFPKTFAWLNGEVIGSLYELSYVSGQKARRELGWIPGPVREGIREAVAWFRDAGRLPKAPAFLRARDGAPKAAA